MPFHPRNWPRLLGVQQNTTSHNEKLISALGGFIGVYFVLFTTHQFVQGMAGALIVASMGASAMLLFVVPHGPLSQPWPVAGGHVLGALCGVTAQIWIDDFYLAGAVAVGLSTAMMYYLRCIHPPGGATALSAVAGGQAVHDLGFQFLLTPVLLNVVIILMVAVVFNYPFIWRRYPFYIAKLHSEKPAAAPARSPAHGIIPRRDLEYALRQMRTFTDMTEEELEKIYVTAKRHGDAQRLKPQDIKLGGYYSHGKLGDDLVVRRIIDESRSDVPEKDMVIYKIVSGTDLYKTGTMTRAAFAKWAKHEVKLYGNVWRELDGTTGTFEMNAP